MESNCYGNGTTGLATDVKLTHGHAQNHGCKDGVKLGNGCVTQTTPPLAKSTPRRDNQPSNYQINNQNKHKNLHVEPHGAPLRTRNDATSKNKENAMGDKMAPLLEIPALM